MKTWSLLILSLFSISLYAQSFKIMKLKGMVLKAYKNESLTPLKKGDDVLVGETVLTGQKSFVRLKSKEGQTIILGPVGKMVIGLTKTKQYSVLNLVKGQLRAKVEKNGKAFYVNSKTASVGVRGTDFLVIHNDINKVTSTLAFSGKVEVFKKSDERILEAIRSTDYSDVESIEEDFTNDDTKFITHGQFTGSFPGNDLTTSPTKISPKQTELLSQNEKLEQAFVKDVLKKKALSDTEKLSEQLSPGPEGESEDVLLPGGLLDLDTGIYIEPPKDAKFNPITKVYELPKKFGTIDKKTGQYKAPEGLELHPLKGFIFRAKRQIKKDITRLKFLRDQLNRKLENKITRFKDVTQLDAKASAKMFYDTNVVEDYYGEKRGITNNEAYGWHLKGSLAHNTFNNKRYLWYPKIFGEMKLHNRRDDANVKRNDYTKWGAGLEFHRKHSLFHNKARFIVDATYNGEYKDFRNKDQFNFYTEDTTVELKEIFQVHRKHKTILSFFGKFYQGYQKSNHGQIYGGKFNHLVDLGRHYEMNYFYQYSKRDSKDELKLHLSELNFKKKEFIRKTDLILSLKGQTASGNAFDFWGGSFEIKRKKGPFLNWSGKYEIEKIGTVDRHIFSGGVIFLF